MDTERCAVCGWPLAPAGDTGCWRGNCSMRPLQRRFYDPERVKQEYGKFAPKEGPLTPVEQQIQELKQHVLALTEARDQAQRQASLLLEQSSQRGDEIKILTAQVQALDAAASWQDIATAPTDGTELLVFDEGAICLAWFDEVSGCWYDQGPMTPEPTHWMKLPAPPAAARRPTEET